MSDYKTIHGISIRDYTTDPDTLITGQVWFDKTNKVLQFQATGAGAWATGGSLNVGGRYGSGFGTQTAGLYFTGLRQGLSADRVETEQYNGSSFSEVGDMNTGRSTYGESGVGTTTAGACIAGYSNPGNSNYANHLVQMRLSLKIGMVQVGQKRQMLILLEEQGRVLEHKRQVCFLVDSLAHKLIKQKYGMVHHGLK